MGRGLRPSADFYDDPAPALRFFDLTAVTLAREAEIPAGATVLDVATGTGKVAVEAASAVDPRGRVIGVNVTTGGSLVVTSSLLRGTVTEFDDRLNRLTSVKVAPAARDAAIAVW